MNNKPNVQYLKVSAGGYGMIEVEFNGTNYNLTVNDSFIGTIEEKDIPRWTKGLQLEHARGRISR